MACIDQIQEKSGIVDLPNYDAELVKAAPRAKTAEIQAQISHFAFRAIVQRLSTGVKSAKSLAQLRTLVKANPFYESASTGLIAASTKDYSTAKTALRKAIALSSDAKATFQGELKLALARVLYATGDDAGAVAEYESLYKLSLIHI